VRRTVAYAAGLITMSVIWTACGDPGTSDGGRLPPSNSYAGTWRLIKGNGPDGEVPMVKGYRITLNITGEQVGGTAACNSYGGDVAIDGHSFRLKGGLQMTEMGCAPQVHDSEAAYVDALTDIDTIARDADTLTLTGPATELDFELVPPPPVAQLTDTVWHLESLIEGTGPDGTVSSAAPARLVLRRDGTVSGSTGCRSLEGEWIERGDEILFTRLAAEGQCSADLQEQDGHVVGALGDGFTTDIEGRTLTVFSKGELGLQYKAE
jgi:heat shock protein HslJ